MTVKRSILSQARGMVSTAVKLLVVLIVGAIVSAALIYCYRAAPFFLWAAVLGGGALGFMVSVSAVFSTLIEDERWFLPAVILFWLVIGVYLDMMRYLGGVWQVPLPEALQAVVEFPRYFAIHTRYFFRDILSVVTGVPSGPVVVVMPEPPAAVPKDAGPWFAVSRYMAEFWQNVFVNVFSTALIAVVVLIWNGRKR